ncbi:MAG: PaaI family thioesterase [Alphaproteobacteria bacterium]|nr:PaaI family thioesterase [Alphaproteobacteria bacterium]MDP6831162.1 PaaI family thioesterase [Alphaproteobacteria bacterium]MDP6874537.1 PaaI family thioesterase [Alphaproteobacteria bacterium]
MSSAQAIARLTKRPPVGASELLAQEPLQIDAARGFARMAYQGKAEFCNQLGVIHGGFLAAMMDEAMAIAATAARGFDYVVPTLGMKTSYLAPAGPGRLIAEGQVVRAEERLVFLEGRLFGGDGELAAVASATARFRKVPWK